MCVYIYIYICVCVYMCVCLCVYRCGTLTPCLQESVIASALVSPKTLGRGVLTRENEITMPISFINSDNNVYLIKRLY